MTEKPIAVVLVSGGMDSCVAAMEARADGHDLAFLHGNYGQRTEARELSCFHAIADRLDVPARRRLVLNLGYLGAIGGSSLTDRDLPVDVSPIAAGADAVTRGSAARRPGPSGRVPAETVSLAQPIGTADSSVGSVSGTGAPPAPRAENPRTRDADAAGVGRSEIPSSYVPFRNAHFLTAAVSWGERLGASAIYIGAVEEDSSGYPDCRETYFRAFQTVIDLGTRPETKIRIVTPLIRRDKASIVRRGIDLAAPFELTWSCYSENEIACGVCDSCALRLRGFELAGAIDPIPYASRP